MLTLPELKENIERSFKSASTYVMLFAGAGAVIYGMIPDADKLKLIAQFPNLIPYSGAILTTAGIVVKWVQGRVKTSKEKSDEVDALADKLYKNLTEMYSGFQAVKALMPAGTTSTPVVATPTPTPTPIPQPDFVPTVAPDPVPEQSKVLTNLEAVVVPPTADQIIDAVASQYPKVDKAALYAALASRLENVKRT